MSVEITDMVTSAIQAYAEKLPNPEFRINLLAAAEHMAPELIEHLGLTQEWALITVEKYSNPPVEVIDRVRYESDSPTPAFNQLEWRRELCDDDDYSRNYVGTRVMTEWVEVHPIVLNADEQKQMDIDQATTSP